MEEDVRVHIRMSPELLEAIKRKEENVSEAIRTMLTEKYMGIEPTKKLDSERIDEIIERARLTAKPSVDTFRLPVGDVICFSTNPQTQLWWCPEERLAQVRELARDWEDRGGFKFCIGQPGRGTWYMPEVIEEPQQERRKGGQFSPSCKMIPALEGDRMVWLEIVRPDKALNYMIEHTDIPCAVRCDIHSYTDNVEYRAAFNKANELFIYYWENGRAKRPVTCAPSESDLCEIFDV